jgi:hypothetical protein
MRQLLDAPARLVDDGRIHFGTFDRPLADVNLLDARPWRVPLPRPLRARWEGGEKRLHGPFGYSHHPFRRKRWGSACVGPAEGTTMRETRV